MSPDDARHGTNGGYLEHAVTDRDYCQPCRDAHAHARRQLWRKRYARRVDRLYVDATGTRRRIRALQALGWRFVDIDAACGRPAPSAGCTWSHNLVRQEKVHIDSAEAVAEAYERLSMTLATSLLANRTRTMAASKGWAPPLAWDDDTIDDPAARPRGGRDVPRKTDVDPVTVDRILAGDRHIKATRAERHEVIRRWPDSINALERLRPDWNVARDLREMREAVA